MGRRLIAVIPTGSIGPPLEAIDTTPTTWASAARTSTQARTTATSTTGGWSAASLVASFRPLKESQECFKDFA
ncbi:hypothetical protein IKF20_02450 [Candidatus Saccharibacteria bacterium]|nr:hypothetical protein [Candidatus Saccharibacteria bacterium]